MSHFLTFSFLFWSSFFFFFLLSKYTQHFAFLGNWVSQEILLKKNCLLFTCLFSFSVDMQRKRHHYLHISSLFCSLLTGPHPHHFTLKFHGWWRVKWHLSPKLPWVSSQFRSPPLQTKLLETHAKLSSPQSYSENLNSLENGRMAKNFSLLSNLKSREKQWFFCDDRWEEKAVRNSVLA